MGQGREQHVPFLSNLFAEARQVRIQGVEGGVLLHEVLVGLGYLHRVKLLDEGLGFVSQDGIKAYA